MPHSLHLTHEKIATRLKLIAPTVYRAKYETAPFALTYITQQPTPATPQLEGATWEPIAWGTYWGRWNTHFALRGAFTLPADAAQPLALWLPIGSATSDFFNAHPEALVYIDGQPIGSIDMRHQEVVLPADLRAGEHELLLYGWTGIGGSYWGDDATTLLMSRCYVVTIDPPTREFIAAARTALEVVGALGEGIPARGKLLDALDAAFNALDTRRIGSDAYYASLPVALGVLRSKLAGAGAPLDMRIDATGHAHIDVAWMWTLDVTRGKAARTFTTALNLMAQYPEYHFTQSQPQLYEYVRQDHPALFERIKAAVAQGTWEPTGGMWIEADCNMSGAESLVRQFLYGRAFFREHFGTDTPILWLPDAFGFPYSLPQLIKQAGLDYFFTIKIGWSQFTDLPHNSFWWQGIDGTRVLTHTSPTPEPYPRSVRATYNAIASGEYAVRTWEQVKHKDVDDHALMVYGYGDGGGGATPEMVENLRELRALAGAPQMQPRRAADFFAALAAEKGARLPVWDGELYLQYHQGTLTTQALNKALNRRSEIALHNAEFAATLAEVLGIGGAYPHAELGAAWKLVLLNQFHDILPGSSIHAVYEDSLMQYAEVLHNVDALLTDSLRDLGAHVGGDLLVMNAAPFSARRVLWADAHLPDGVQVTHADGTPVPVQRVDEGLLLDVGEIPPYSLLPLVLTDRPAPALESPLSVSAQHLENDMLRVEFNADGDITRIYDKTHARELLPVGALGNQLQLFEDRPKDFDAWNIDVSFTDRQWLAEPAHSVRVVEQGALCATLEITRKLGHASEITQRVSLYAHSAQLDFRTEIDWQERSTLLKVAFPLEIHATYATYDIQWGSVQRATHTNTAYEWGQYEVCAHLYADLSEGNYGVSLLNDAKYGYDVRGNVMRLTLLRGAVYPDPDADIGHHRFTYSLLPHAGAVGTETLAAAHALNNPPQVFRNGGGAPSTPAPLVTCDAPNVVIQTVKAAEDGNGFIVRLYESQRQRGSVTLTFGAPVGAVQAVNLLEEPLGAAQAVTGGRYTLTLKPFEIVSLRVVV